MAALHSLRGALALALVLLYFAVFAFPSLALANLVGIRSSPRRRIAWASYWANLHARAALAILAAGGASSERRGAIRTDEAGIVLMNHQSVLDIPVVMQMCAPLVPAFVARARYAKVPVIGDGLRLAHCPVIDPGRDREQSLRTLALAVQEERALLIYPEGHRSRDGSLQPFRTAGLLAMLEARRVPVWLVVTDGFCPGRRLVDLVRLDRIRGVTRLVGRFEPPADAGELPAFLAELEARLGRALADLRVERTVASSGRSTDPARSPA